MIDKYAKLSFGVGFIPVPAIDLIALTGLQMKMLSNIAKIYDQSYSQNKMGVDPFVRRKYKKIYL